MLADRLRILHIVHYNAQNKLAFIECISFLSIGLFFRSFTHQKAFFFISFRFSFIELWTFSAFVTFTSAAVALHTHTHTPFNQLTEASHLYAFIINAIRPENEERKNNNNIQFFFSPSESYCLIGPIRFETIFFTSLFVIVCL